ncbi:GTP pyrophosphokinase [wastewater metagenome]|uniref:GTP pyrophosphokinase n=2 Tax=unclassified sequences TaxID=12908 RepID=A0A5B8RGV0_9ZZZZ|nr:GTP diphosphokinase [Arhodomonas aquaeolei]QEA07118.1 GTP pyrophosphokinase [uncultured organism]
MVQVTGELGDIADVELDFPQWVERLPLSPDDGGRALLERAWTDALAGYGEAERPSGESYMAHAVAVAGVVASLRLDAETVAAALLHDLPSFPDYDSETLRRRFGGDIATMVDGAARIGVVSELHSHPGGTGEDRTEALRKMLFAMARDIRVVFLVLAERLQDMRVVRHLDEDARSALARETLDLYAPLANRLGIWQLKWELEDRAFALTEPATYKRVARLLAEKRVDRERYIGEVREALAEALRDAGIDAEVKGRPKHIYSIWRKMQRKGLSFEELFDIRALRVMVDTVAQCYAALGVVHALWQPIPREFDDYIATPKENNYQSLHTAVVGPGGKNVEIQIRTREMHQSAELGIAAHWRYKEGRGQDPGFDGKIAWIRQLLETNPEEGGEDLFDRFKAEVFEDRVYVITPRGDVFDLPRGATPLDFAYAVHSQVGHRCRGAKVNGRIVPLTYQLHNGDQVEVLTARNGQPSRDWLNPALGYLVTPRARAHVRTWFRQQDFDQNVADGRAIVDRELGRLGLQDVNLERLAARSRYPQLDAFFAALGRGDVTGGQIAGLLDEQLRPRRETPPPARRRPGPQRSAGGSDDVTIYGVGNLLTRLAGCCQPAPGDPIVGFITRGQGVTVHRRDCASLARLQEEEDPGRFIEVSWNDETDSSYPVDVRVLAYDRQGLLRDVTTLISNEGVRVDAVNTHTDPDSEQARITLTVRVSDLAQLGRLIDRLAGLRNVVDVRRAPGG